MGKYGILIVLIAAIAVFPGCGSGKSNLAQNWGRSYELNKYNQNLNPKAEKNLHPVAGLDGNAAASIMTMYQKSFKGQQGAPSSGSLLSAPSSNMGSTTGGGY